MPTPTDSDLQKWKDRIRNGQRFQEKFAKSNEWEQYKRYYRHSFAGPKGKIIPVNMVFSILRSLVPQVYFRNPKITVTPRGYSNPLIEINARIVQQIDNWLLRELNTKYQMRSMIQDAFICGISAGFSGYDAVELDSTGKRLEFDVGRVEGMPWFVRCRPDDVVFPWGCVSANTAPWVAMRFFKPVDALKRDKTYSNVKDLKGTSSPKRTQPEGAIQNDPAETQATNETKDQEWAELWQVYDYEEGKIKVLNMGHDKWLRDDDFEYIDGIPVDVLVFNPDNDYIYGVPDARIIEPQLLELIDIRTQSMKHRRINLIRTIGKKGILSQIEKDKLMSEEVMPYVEVDADTTDIRTVLMPWAPGVAGILQDLALQGQIVQGDVRESVGFSRVAQGEFQGKTHVSAEETKNVARALNIRLDERRDLVSDLLTRLVRRWNQYIFKNWSTEQVAKIIGIDGANYWVKFTGQQIKGEYDYLVEPEEGQPLDSQTKVANAVAAAKAWSDMNQGAVKMGAPVPLEIQRVVFANIEGINMDRLMAELQQVNKNASTVMQAQAGQAGSSPENPISPGGMAG